MGQDTFHQIVNAVVMVCADGSRVAHAELVELRSVEFPVVVVYLVDRQHNGLVGCSQPVGGYRVGGGHTVSHIGHQYDHVGVGHGHFCLLLHLGPNGPFRVCFQPAGVQQNESTAFPVGVCHQTVAGRSGNVGHDGMPPSDDAVEERRLAHVGATDYGDDWKRHWCCFLFHKVNKMRTK